MKVPFVDLSIQHRKIAKELEEAIKKTTQRGDFILGEEVKAFEKEFAKYCGSKFAVGVNSGTDALFLGLLSLGIGPDDEVIVPAFTYIATALAVTFSGARPVFADVRNDTYNIDLTKIRSAITKKTKAIIPVHLYGQPADMDPILNLAREYNLRVIEDAAQAHGATYKVRNAKAGAMGDIGCFSFYPSKNLGALGDGGMLITNDDATYNKLLMLRDYGRKSKYEHASIGYNSRLDTLQAGILRVKLRHLDEWNASRIKAATLYNNKLKKIADLITPYVSVECQHVFHVYAIRLKERQRVIDELKKRDIGVLIHYPIPPYLQGAYKELKYQNGDFPVSEQLSREVISLPMFPFIEESQVDYVVDSIGEITRKG
jgi:dTDP-4-amino-4,6-dideoxygalactose transaminase